MRLQFLQPALPPGGQYQQCRLQLACTAHTDLQGADTGSSLRRMSQSLLYHCSFKAQIGFHITSWSCRVETPAGISEQLFLMLTVAECCFWLEYIKRHILQSIMMPCIWKLSLLLLHGNLITACCSSVSCCSSLVKFMVAAAKRFIRINSPFLLEAFRNCPSLQTY